MFKPSKKSAYSQLCDFLPKAGIDYAANRNYDNGAGEHKNVSQLSPWLRLRMIPEWEVIRNVLERNNESGGAGKFIDEVCWRTYWKGWLQLRPEIWDDYLDELEIQLNQWGNDKRYLSVINGQSGIECMDAWTKELIQTGYLHNHSRMWYSSIWIHTLQLHWSLGAAFFLTHLFDGDAASNTLSWRWVAGLHTIGKTYLARPGNVRKYTSNRFEVNEPLAENPLKITAKPLPKPRLIPHLKKPQDGSKIGLLVQEDDLSASDWISKEVEVHCVAGLFLKDNYKTHRIVDSVADFRLTCLNDTLGESTNCLESIEASVLWAKQKELDAVVMAEIPIGLWNDSISTLEYALRQNGVELYFVRHWWDELLHPHTKAGFFRFKKAIPEALSKLTASTE